MRLYISLRGHFKQLCAVTAPKWRSFYPLKFSSSVLHSFSAISQDALWPEDLQNKPIWEKGDLGVLSCRNTPSGWDAGSEFSNLATVGTKKRQNRPFWATGGNNWINSCNGTNIFRIHSQMTLPWPVFCRKLIFTCWWARNHWAGGSNLPFRWENFISFIGTGKLILTCV